MRIKDKVAIVTGGGSGIGEEIVLLLAKEGARVVVAEIFEERARKVAQKIQESGSKALPLMVDVSNSKDTWSSLGWAFTPSISRALGLTRCRAPSYPRASNPSARPRSAGSAHNRHALRSKKEGEPPNLLHLIAIFAIKFLHKWKEEINLRLGQRLPQHS